MSEGMSEEDMYEMMRAMKGKSTSMILMQDT